MRCWIGGVTLGLLAALSLLTGCSSPKAKANVESLTREFVESSLALSPTSATAAGLHQYQGRKLDEELDDLSPAGIRLTRDHLLRWRNRLAGLDLPTLNAEERADIELMNGQIDAQLFEIDRARSYTRQPQMYVELVGNALFVPFSVNYAPELDRWRHIIARLRLVPILVSQARQQLKQAPPVWIRVAKEENEGNIELIDQVFRSAVPPAVKGEYAAAAGPALKALQSLNEAIGALPSSGEESWRMGKDLYQEKFRLTLGKGITPDQLLAQAEDQIKQIRKRMFELALPLHQRYYPGHHDPVDLNLIVRETMDKIAEDHVARADYFKEAELTLAETRSFMAAHASDLVAPSPNDNLKIIETPEFMRGIYGVGGFNPAPPLEPKLGAYYWITPIPENWPPERVESKLREYNRYGLRILTIHEAIPGHYVQFEYANRIEDWPRRVLRSVAGSGVYVEGWAVYATDIMLAAGYMDHRPEMELTWSKQLLRAIANSVLDIRNHTGNFTREQALDLMIKETFQEKEEAEAKWQRAQLSACQLPTYFTGYLQWKKLREEMQAKGGSSFSLQQFHERALAEGALPMETLRALLLSGSEGKTAAAPAGSR